MIWNNWSDFIAMGGYGLYVWSSFGVTAVAVAAEVLSVAVRRKAALAACAIAIAHESGDGE